MSNFKERFNLLKTEKNLSLKIISDNVGISVSSLSKAVNGKLQLKHSLVENLAKYFNVSKSYLIGESEFRQNDIELEEGYIKFCLKAKSMNVDYNNLNELLNLISNFFKN